MTSNVKIFIENNIGLIEDNDWDNVFKSLLQSMFNNKDSYILKDFILTLNEAGIQPFDNNILSLFNVKDFPSILDALSGITGYDNNAEQVYGDLAYRLKEDIGKNIDIKNLAKIALKLGFKVYRTPNTYWGYDEDDQDYLILHPYATIKDYIDWDNSYRIDEYKIEFNPDEYKQIYEI